MTYEYSHQFTLEEEEDPYPCDNCRTPTRGPIYVCTHHVRHEVWFCDDCYGRLVAT